MKQLGFIFSGLIQVKVNQLLNDTAVGAKRRKYGTDNKAKLNQSEVVNIATW